MPRGGARVGAGRPKGSLGKPAAAKGDKRFPAGPRAYGEAVWKDGNEARATDKSKRREERRLRGDDARRVAKRSRHATFDPRGDRPLFGRKTTRVFVDDLAAVAAEDDDADYSFLETNETRQTPNADVLGIKSGQADRTEAASRLAELRGRWEFAEVLAFFTAFRFELRDGVRRATKALGLRETHWAAAPPTAADLERALADPEGKLAFFEGSGFFEKTTMNGARAPSNAGDGSLEAEEKCEAPRVDVEPTTTTVCLPNASLPNDDETDAKETAENSTAENRRRVKNAAVLARTHLALLFGIEPETRCSDKPPSGGWSKRWPEWTARVSGERVSELFGRRERNAPFDRSAFETIVEVEEDVPGHSGEVREPGVDATATKRTETADGYLSKPLKEKEKKRLKEKKRRVVTRRSATEAYAAVTPTRRLRALWGLCEARLACGDIREKAASLTARDAGAVSLGADAAGCARWYVGRRREGCDDDDDGDESDAAYDVVCGVARVCRAAPPRWDVYADAAEKRAEEPLFEEPRVEEREASPSPSRRAHETKASPISAANGVHVTPEKSHDALSPNATPIATPSRGALEYAERAIWADPSSAEADAAARWAFVLEEEPSPLLDSRDSATAFDGSESSEDDGLSDLDSPSPDFKRRRGKQKTGKKPAMREKNFSRKKRETVEARFARRARCDPRDVICSLASEGKWAEVCASKSAQSRKTNALEKNKRVCSSETAEEGAEKAVGESLLYAKNKKKATQKRDTFLTRGDVPPYHRFAPSFVAAPLCSLAVGDVSETNDAEGAKEMVRLDDIPCAWCGDTSGESAFVLCDGCPNGGHLACLGLRGVPKNAWFCAVCADGGEGADAPRTRVVRRLAHPRFAAASARNGGKRPRAPREGAWETVAEERELWGGGVDGESPISKSTVETHASFAKLAYARASARWREATRRAAAAARAERAALDARRAERLALRDDDFFDDDDDDDDERDSEDDTEDDSEHSDSERARRAKSTFVSEGNGDRLVARGDARPSRETDDAADGFEKTRQKTTPRSLEKTDDVYRGRERRLGTPASVLMASENEHAFARLCARCGDACFSRFLGHGSVEETDDVCGASFAKCAFCPAEGHRFCVFGDEGPGTTRKRDDACLVCAAASRNPSSLVRAPPSPVERRRFPRRVSSRVRDALESDDDDAWRFE